MGVPFTPKQGRRRRLESDGEARGAACLPSGFSRDGIAGPALRRHMRIR